MKSSKILIKLLFLCLFSVSVTAQSINIDRIEPPNWWTGFENQEVQLLVYGDDIKSADITVDYPGVTLERVTLVENSNYQFLTLKIHKEADPGSVKIKFERNNSSYTHDYKLKARSKDPVRNAGFDASDVIYLLMPDRFANGNPEISEIAGMLESVDRSDPRARHGGDIQGIINNLDYIQDLGMTAVWFTPVFENDMPPEYGAYHGYAATDMYKIDRRFGSNADFLKLVEKAHDMGLKVIMDMIHNHVGTEHWFVKDPPTSDWVHPLEEVGTTNYRTTTVMDPYASDYDYNATVKGWFVTDMPDLNQRNELLATYLIQNTLWWIEYSGIDGIRMDTYPYPYRDYMAKWAKVVLNEFPDFNIVGEAWMHNVPSTAYWQTGFPGTDGYESYLPSVTDFPFYSALVTGLNEEGGWNTGLSRFYFNLSQDFLYPDPQMNVIFPGNHDLDRIFSVVGEDFNKFKMAMVKTLTSRGIPQLYYGDEILMTGEGEDGLKRKDFPGGWQSDPIDAFSHDGRRELGEKKNLPVSEAYEFVKTLAHWRNGSEAIHSGKLTHFIPENNVYVYFRYLSDEMVMVVLNGNEEHYSLSLERFSEKLDGYEKGLEIIRGQELIINDFLELEPWQSLIIDLND